MSDFPFIEKMKKIQDAVLAFIENVTNTEEKYEDLLQKLKDEQISADRVEFKLFLLLIANISNYHFRNSFFTNKIEQILHSYFQEIQKYFTNDEIFQIFKKNKLLLLFLIENKILNINEEISSIMIDNTYFSERQYVQYFYPEVKNYISLKMDPIPTDFYDKRKIGENDSEISELIRNDKIKEFIIYVNKNYYSLNSKIKESIFETNSILLKNQPSLIEYAAFFGSVQIFNYLYLNGAILSSSIWEYGIHGSNPEIIHTLEEKKILPHEKNYIKCLSQSIKYFNSDMTNYFQNNYINENEMNSSNFSKYKKNIYSKSFQYHNFFCLPNKLNQKIFFFFACEFDYLNIVKYFIKTNKISINAKTIFNCKNLNSVLLYFDVS